MIRTRKLDVAKYEPIVELQNRASELLMYGKEVPVPENIESSMNENLEQQMKHESQLLLSKFENVNKEAVEDPCQVVGKLMQKVKEASYNKNYLSAKRWYIQAYDITEKSNMDLKIKGYIYTGSTNEYNSN